MASTVRVRVPWQSPHPPSWSPSSSITIKGTRKTASRIVGTKPRVECVKGLASPPGPVSSTVELTEENVGVGRPAVNVRCKGIFLKLV